MAQWSELPPSEACGGDDSGLKTPLSVLRFKPCWFSFLFSVGWSVAAADGAKPDCTF
jgi:hypothetical protein